jgi:lipoprotein-anchoring transpeptidase ErfK/SrfK
VTRVTVARRSCRAWRPRAFAALLAGTAIAGAAPLAVAGPAAAGPGVAGSARPAPDAPVQPVARKAATTAHVIAPLVARRVPSRNARAVWTVPTATEWSRQAQVLLVLRSARDASGRRWLKVELPIRPNASSGWIPADGVRLGRTVYWIEISTGRRVVTVYRDGRVVRRFRAVVGAPATPTPHGLFALWEKNPQPDPAAFLGPWALPLTALSDVLASYGGGPGRVGIHGRAGLSFQDPLGTAASHGCIRVDNRHIVWLAHRVPRGTPVLIGR